MKANRTKAKQRNEKPTPETRGQLQISTHDKQQTDRVTKNSKRIEGKETRRRVGLALHQLIRDGYDFCDLIFELFDGLPSEILVVTSEMSIGSSLEVDRASQL